jgi:hypothetical protein
VERVVVNPVGLLSQWRERAAFLEQYGDPTSARLWRLAALELDAALKALGDETLTLVEAAALSGYSADHLGHLIRHGQLRNCGRKNAPRVRRADLPIKSPTKPGRPVQQQRGDGGRVTNITKLTRRKR